MIFNLIVIALILTFGRYYSIKATDVNTSKKALKNYIKTICFILILQSALRNVAVGDDTYNYFLMFEDVKTTSWDSIYNSLVDYIKYGVGKDEGFLIFQKVTQIITDNFQVYLFIVALIFFSALGSFIYKNTSKIFDATLAFLIYTVLFYPFFSITGIRQTIATAAALYCYELIKTKRLIKFLLIILLASTIHKSVLIFIPFYFIIQLKSSRYLYRIILFLFPVIMMLKGSLATLLINFGGYEEYEEYAGAGTFNFTAMFLLMCIVGLIRTKVIMKNNPNASHYYNAFAIALLLLPLSWVNPSFLRITMYFTLFMLLFIPAIIDSFDAVSIKLKNDIRVFVIIILLALFIKTNWGNDGYAFYWEYMRLPSQYYIRD